MRRTFPPLHRYTALARGVRETYLDLALALNFLVDGLLLLGVNRLLGRPPNYRRCALAALLGAGYAAACLLPGWRFLGSIPGRMGCLALMARIAFGGRREGIRAGLLFLLLSLALGGAAMGFGGGFFGILGAAGCIFLLALYCMGGNRLAQRLLDVELTRNGSKVRLLALADTGNGLRDPITGEQVLIIGPEAAQVLTGLTKKQLADPVGTLAERPIPGLRLIPYRVVGHGGMLLALAVDQARIGQYRGRVLVAFAPEELEASGRYQALAGGMSG